MSESIFHSPSDDNEYIPYSALINEYRSYNRIPYRRLLFTKEWDAKRRKILERDNNTCQSCNKEKPRMHSRRTISANFAPRTNFIRWNVVGNNRFIEGQIKHGFYWLVSTKKFKKSDKYDGYMYVNTPSGSTLINADSFQLHVHHKSIF